MFGRIVDWGYGSLKKDRYYIEELFIPPLQDNCRQNFLYKLLVQELVEAVLESVGCGMYQ